MNAPLRSLAIAVALAGCGKSSAPTSAPPSVGLSPPPSSGSSPSGADRSPAALTRGRTAAVPAPPPVPDGALLVGGTQPNFTFAGFADNAPANQFVVQSPLPGLDSTFVMVESPAASPPAAAVRLPAGFSPAAATEYGPEGRPLRIRCDADGALMSLVPAGPFLQGTDDAEPAAGPQHAIDLDAYYIDVHEVTFGQFYKFREALKAEKKTPPLPLSQNVAGSELPATDVPWRSAMLYATWAGKQLPTEAEWEKAGRGAEGFRFPWGNGRPLWPAGRGIGQLTLVGTTRLDESPYGVMDMAGNAREWCHDWYADDAYKQFETNAGIAVKNWPGPRNADKAGRRVVKGGQTGWETWRRAGISMNETAPDVGFRCVLRLSEGVSPAEPREANPRPGAAARTPEPTRPPPSGF